MAAVNVNKLGRGAFCCVLACSLFSVVCATGSNETSSDETSSPVIPSRTFVNDNCTQKLTLQAGTARPIPTELLQQLPTRTYITYDVKACSDADVTLYAMDFSQQQPEVWVISIVMGKDNQSESSIHLKPLAGGTVQNQTGENPLSCSASAKFAVTWENDVQVFKNVDGGWQSFLTYNYRHTPLQVYNVFVAYKLGDQNDSSTAEWRFDVPCHAISVDLSSMVTRGHLVGAVIAALLGGIILGAVCISFAPRLIEYIREANVLPNSRKNDADRTEEREEMATLVRVEASPSSPDRAPAPAPTAVEVPTPKLDLALPGDNPPPGNSPQGRRKASNAYTPYLEMGGTAATAAGAGAKRDDVARSLNVTQQAPRNISPTRMTSPLPALPGDDVEKAVTPGTSPDDLYANSDAHVYEGMRLDAPIYENRETRVYESLKRAPTEQQ